MHKRKLTTLLIAAGLMTAAGTTRAAEAEAATPPLNPKPAARPTSLPPASTQKDVTFAKDIKPLLDASCVRCHGGERPKAHLRLDSLAGVMAGSEDGKVVVVGDSAKSKIVNAIARLNPKTAMPPEPRQGRGGRPGWGGPGGAGPAPGAPEAMKDSAGKAGTPTPTSEGPAKGASGDAGQGQRRQGPPPKPLTAEEVGLVRAWIDQGAK
jgi:hypothetical protein